MLDMTPGANSRQTMVRESIVPKGKLVSIEALREEISWTIPSFPVLTLTFAIVVLQGGQLGVIKSSDKSQLKSFPVIVDCWSPNCEITIGANAYTVFWDWELLHNASENTDFLDSLLDLDNEHINKQKESSNAGIKSQSEKLLKDDFLDSLLGLNEDANLHEVSSRSRVKSKQDGRFNDNFLDSLLALNKHNEAIMQFRIQNQR